MNYFKQFENILITLKNLLLQNNLTIATAESCTGGLLGAVFTSIPGSSTFYKGGFVVYSNDLKIKLLNIEEKIINNFGAVSKECSEAMANSLQFLTNANINISITGIAGPDGGTPDKPVGTIFSTFIFNNKKNTYHFKFNGTRNQIREKIIKKILEELFKFLNQ